MDANVLLYAVDGAGAHHDASLAWLEDALSGSEAVGFSWVVLLAFIRIATSPAVFPNAMSVDEALDQVEAWLEAPAAVNVEPTGQHAKVLHRLLAEVGSAGNLVTDAHLAALALQHRADLLSYDRDFARFSEIRHRLPELPS